MTNDYDYISVSTDSELMTAFNKVMSESTSQQIIYDMAMAGLAHHSILVETMKKICDINPDIYKLVNSEILKERTNRSQKGRGMLIIQW